MALPAIFRNKCMLGPLAITAFAITAQTARCQVMIKGTIHTRKDGLPLRGVSVLSVYGGGTSSDSLGRYSIRLLPGDSIFYSWLGKVTEKFAVKDIPPNEPFDLNLDEVNIRSLPAISVNGPRDYLTDSISNRVQYQNVFGYQTKSGPQEKNMSQASNFGLGWDVNNLLNPSDDNRSQALQQRLAESEKDKYIDHRFNPTLVKRITGLESPALDSFIKLYRPTYETLHSFETEYEYYQWISVSAKNFNEKWNREFIFKILSNSGFLWY
jgi:hypothetical protein